MREKFNLDVADLSRTSILIHGINAAGKTYLVGDFLSHESKDGPVRFINMVGEDGAMACASFGLGEVGENIDSYDSLEQAFEEYQKEKVRAIGMDSLSWLNSAVRVKAFGSNRMPRNPDEWTELHRLMGNIIQKGRRSAMYFMATCPSDRSVDQVTQKTYITPDLPGKEARSSAGWFDFVGYLKAENIRPGTVTRTFIIAPNELITVRQRLPHQITEDIKLPDGPGGWKVIKDKIEGNLSKVREN